MPNIQSAKKRMKTSEKSRLNNRTKKGTVSARRSKLYAAFKAGDKAGAEAVLPTYFSAVDKAVKAGTLTKNAANRRKSRASARLTAMA